VHCATAVLTVGPALRSLRMAAGVLGGVISEMTPPSAPGFDSENNIDERHLILMNLVQIGVKAMARKKKLVKAVPYMRTSSAANVGARSATFVREIHPKPVADGVWPESQLSSARQMARCNR
jgi:hypothetical protein